MIRFCLCFILCCNGILAQQNSNAVSLHIDYSHAIKIEGSPNATVVSSRLYVNTRESLYEMDFLNQENFVSEEEGEKGSILRIRSTKNPKIYKALKSGYIFSIERIGMKPFLVKDSVGIFEWSLKDEFKTILGYNCQKADLSYRGRRYTAYFTTKIPFNSGPWKFDGLPGTILEIKEENEVLSIIANKIELLNKDTEIENPFEKEPYIFWAEFIKKYKKKNEELLSYSGENGVTRSLPKKKIEVLIED